MCCRKPSYFFSFFYFLAKFQIFAILFSLVYLYLSEEKILLLFPVYYLAVFMDNYSLRFLYLILK